MVVLVLDLALALFPGAGVGLAVMDVLHHALFGNQGGQCLLAILWMLFQKVLIDGTGLGGDTAIGLGGIKQRLSFG